MLTQTNATEFDRLGTELWNFATRSRRDVDPGGEDACALIRVFSFSLLDCIKAATQRTPQNNLRLLKIGIKAAKVCLEDDDAENAQGVLSSAASITDALSNRLGVGPGAQESAEKDQDLIAMHRSLNVEYLTVRIMLVRLATSRCLVVVSIDVN